MATDAHQAGAGEVLLAVVGRDEYAVVELIDLERKSRSLGVAMRDRELVAIAALATQHCRQTHRFD